MSLASSAYYYKIRSHFLLFTKLLHQSHFLVTRNWLSFTPLSQVTFSYFWGWPRMLLATCATRNMPPHCDSPLLGPLSFDLYCPWPAPYQQVRDIAAICHLLLLLWTYLGGPWSSCPAAQAKDRQRPLMNSPKRQQSVNKAKLSQFKLTAGRENTIFIEA